MKKLATTFGLLALMLIVTSFTTPSEIGGVKPSPGEYNLEIGGVKPSPGEYNLEIGGVKPSPGE